jgi:alpha-ketoglutarate-dependent taurine dioxygenase
MTDNEYQPVKLTQYHKELVGFLNISETRYRLQWQCRAVWDNGSETHFRHYTYFDGQRFVGSRVEAMSS